ncbi:DUF4214 domain-containing protein [Sphingobium sp. YBL2]|uniref:DUF4214 domain-containing protein n=1 Tax=Sphingobium sp. (strain YBL2) TaxID=484429 RepID=UPI000A028ED6|nr:DUF4214 domain-containing protein [Sphingobium sp. YBL2]
MFLQRRREINSSAGIPHVESLHELLSLPSALFLRTAYQRVLGRDADEAGFLNYMKALSEGYGKDSILISLMNSDEARQLANANKRDGASANLDVLSRELAQLCEAHNKNGLVHRFFRGWRSRVKRKELNALEFKLESMFLSMLAQVKSETLQEITYRADLHHEGGKPAHSNLRTVEVIQAQRRSVSRPASEA